MKLRVPKTASTLLLVIVALGFCDIAGAFPQFAKQFVAKYTEDNADYEAKVKEAKCFVCHQGKSKKNRNAYGEALHQYLGKKDRKDVEKILAALDTVAAESSDPGDADAPTFGELIAAGELPGGTLDECKEEPADDEQTDSDSEEQ